MVFLKEGCCRKAAKELLGMRRRGSLKSTMHESTRDASEQTVMHRKKETEEEGSDGNLAKIKNKKYLNL